MKEANLCQEMTKSLFYEEMLILRNLYVNDSNSSVIEFSSFSKINCKLEFSIAIK